MLNSVANENNCLKDKHLIFGTFAWKIYARLKGKYTVVRQHEASSEFNVQLFREALSKMEGRHNFSSFVKSKGGLSNLNIDGQSLLRPSKYQNILSGLKKYWKEGGAYISHPRTTEELTKTVFSINVEESPPPISPSVYPPYNQVLEHFLPLSILFFRLSSWMSQCKGNPFFIIRFHNVMTSHWETSWDRHV